MVCRKTVLALLFAAMALAVSCSSGGQPTPSPGATTGASPTPTAAVARLPTATASAEERPEILEGAEVVQLQQGPEGNIPGNLALIIETGCWQCDGPTSGLMRVYTRADGSVVVDTLFDPDSPSFGPRRVTTSKGVEKVEPYITGFAAREDGSEIVVSLCVAETCGSGGLDAWSPGSKTLLLRSTDGGITWERWGEVGVGGFVVSLAGLGKVIVGTWEAENQPPQLAYFPGLAPLPAPARDAWPFYVLDGEVIWRDASGSRLLRSDGSTIVDVGPDAWVTRARAASTTVGAALLVTWSWHDHVYVSFLDSDGRLIDTYEAPAFALSGVDLGKGLLIGNLEADPARLKEPLSEGVFGYLPATFHLGEGIVTPILHPFIEPDFPRGRNHVVAAMQGFFSRVEAPGSCLNVRTEPDSDSRVLTCAANGALLRGIGLSHAGETVEAEGVTWLHVLTPDGLEGWASTEFFER